MQAAYETLKRIAPRSELKGMLAVQMIAPTAPQWSAFVVP